MPDASTEIPVIVVESPPPAATPSRDVDDESRARLNVLAQQLIRTHNRRLLVEFLRLRRNLRA
jgi:hypothetical protein